ncbi:MAG: glycoside hydrolase family 27 protein [Lachnospiraceae bacterium]|nr:glycoside hydrolase family 27 protein [Lachnospiraceae bacterium]
MKKKDLAALTPPMGWNSWDCFGNAVNEGQLLANARYMKEYLLPFGWEYVVCDIQWSEPHAGEKEPYYDPFAPLLLDEYGRQLPAPERFPSAKEGQGFRPLAERIHEMGLKFGIHIMRGVPRLAVHRQLPVKGTDTTYDEIAHPSSICRWNSDMYGIDYTKEGAQAYYDSIFELYAAWGVDYVKVDDICNTNAYPEDPYSAEREIEMIRKAIDGCGRTMVLSLSPGPAVIGKAWHLRENANLWRVTDDFWDDWKLLLAMFERCEVWERQVSPGCWPDCDMLPVGRLRLNYVKWAERLGGPVETWTKFTEDEQVTMMSLWCIFRSPLMVGAHLPDNDEFTLRLLTNPEILRMHRFGTDAHQVLRTPESCAWMSRDAENGAVYLALFNLSDERAAVSAELEDLGLSGSRHVRDLWERRTLADVIGRIAAELPAHGAAVFALS